MFVKKTQIPIRLSDVDLAGHVHNSKYLDYFEAGRMAYMADFVPADHDWKALGLILARNVLDYLAPVRLNDDASINVWCSAVGRKSFTLEYEMHVTRDSTEVPVCREKSVMVCFDYHAQQTIAIPDGWRQELENRQ